MWAPASPGRASGAFVAIDDDTLLRLLDWCAPVLPRLGLVRDRAAFLVNEAFRPPALAPSFDAAILFDVEDGARRLHDVVSPTMPDLDDVIALIPGRYGRVETYFVRALEPQPRVDDASGVRWCTGLTRAGR